MSTRAAATSIGARCAFFYFRALTLSGAAAGSRLLPAVAQRQQRCSLSRRLGGCRKMGECRAECFYLRGLAQGPDATSTEHCISEPGSKP